MGWTFGQRGLLFIPINLFGLYLSVVLSLLSLSLKYRPIAKILGVLFFSFPRVFWLSFFFLCVCVFYTLSPISFLKTETQTSLSLATTSTDELDVMCF